MPWMCSSDSMLPGRASASAKPACLRFLQLALLTFVVIGAVLAEVPPIVGYKYNAEALQCISKTPKVISSFGTVCQDYPGNQIDINSVTYKPFYGVRWNKDNIYAAYSNTPVEGVSQAMQPLYRAECGDHRIFLDYRGGGFLVTKSFQTPTCPGWLATDAARGMPLIMEVGIFKNGFYKLTMMFAEDYYNNNDRRFSIFVEDEQIVSKYSIWERAGGLYKPVNVTWVGYVDDEMLKVQLYQISNAARFGSILVEELDCRPTPKPQQNPPPCSGNPPQTSCNNRRYTWGAVCRSQRPALMRTYEDVPARYIINGVTYNAVWTTPYITNPTNLQIPTEYTDDIQGSAEDLVLFQGECAQQRIDVDFPVPNGYYKVTVMEAETYWGNPNSMDRKNDIICSKRRFDIWAEGQLRVPDYCSPSFAQANRIVIGNIKVSDGNLTLSFRAKVDSAHFSAILVELISCDTSSPNLSSDDSNSKSKWKRWGSSGSKSKSKPGVDGDNSRSKWKRLINDSSNTSSKTRRSESDDSRSNEQYRGDSKSKFKRYDNSNSSSRSKQKRGDSQDSKNKWSISRNSRSQTFIQTKYKEDVTKCLQNNPKTIKAAGTICMDVPSGTTSINQVKYRPFDNVRWGKNNVKVFYSPTEVAGVPASMQTLYRAECGDHSIFVDYEWPNGYVRVTFFEAENYWDDCSREFNLYVQNEQVVSRFCIIKEAGGKFKPVNITWAGYVDSQKIDIEFYRVLENTKFGAIMVEQLDCNQPPKTPVRAPACVGNNPRSCFKGSRGDKTPYTWAATCRSPHPPELLPNDMKGPLTKYIIDGITYDAIYMTSYVKYPQDLGLTEWRDKPVNKTGNKLVLYQGECAAPLMKIAFPVPKGRYTVTLFETEMFWGNPDSVARKNETICDNRQFDIIVEGQLAVKGYCAKRFGTATKIKITNVIVSDGELNVQLNAIKDNAHFSTILVELKSCDISSDPHDDEYDCDESTHYGRA